jgi:hypothetical protein
MKEAPIHSNQALIADHQSAEVAQPGESPLDFPTMAVSLLNFGRLMFVFSVSAVRDQEANPPAAQAVSQFVRVISLIADEALGPTFGATTAPPGDFYRFQSPFRQLYFRGRRRGNGASQRNTLAVDHHHPLRALPPLGRADAVAPFFAGAKLASIKASSQSRRPSASSRERNVRQIFSQMSCSSQVFSRRQQVDELGYLLGKSCQGAPVRRIQRIPSKTSRLSLLGRPPLEPGLSDGNKGAIFNHWVSFRNLEVAAIGPPPIAYYAKTIKMSSFFR